MRRGTKYHNHVIQTPYGKFDSQHEYDRFLELQLLQRGGLIKSLGRQIKYTLLPAQYDDGKCVERSVVYVADFVYTDVKTGKTIVEDAKGVRTPDYIIKRKLMLHEYGIRIREV